MLREKDGVFSGRMARGSMMTEEPGEASFSVRQRDGAEDPWANDAWPYPHFKRERSKPIETPDKWAEDTRGNFSGLSGSFLSLSLSPRNNHFSKSNHSLVASSENWSLGKTGLSIPGILECGEVKLTQRENQKESVLQDYPFISSSPIGYFSEKEGFNSNTQSPLVNEDVIPGSDCVFGASHSDQQDLEDLESYSFLPSSIVEAAINPDKNFINRPSRQSEDDSIFLRSSSNSVFENSKDVISTRYYGPGSFSEASCHPLAVEDDNSFSLENPDFLLFEETDRTYYGSVTHPLHSQHIPQQHAQSRRVCTFFIQGNCRYGEFCRSSHFTGDSCPHCDKKCGESIEQQQLHLSICEELDLIIEDRVMSKDFECCLCGENIVSSGRKFGLLTGCNHSFCLKCIREWKGETSHKRDHIRRCPECRKESLFVIPSDRMILEPDRKEKAIAKYRDKLSQIPCKWHDYGHGSCPFGKSCFYLHSIEDRKFTNTQRSRHAENADGHVEVMRNVCLADFLR